jgi:hypothetical protein
MMQQQRPELAMTPLRIGAFLLIVLGALGLAYRQFTITKETHEAKVGPVEFKVKDRETIHVPTWLGIGAIVLGGVVLLVGKGR